MPALIIPFPYRKTIRIGETLYEGEPHEASVFIEASYYLLIWAELRRQECRRVRMEGQCLKLLLTFFPEHSLLREICHTWEKWHLCPMPLPSDILAMIEAW